MRPLTPLTLLMLLAPPATTADAPTRVRFAQFNVFELSREKVDQVDAAGRGVNAQLRKAAEILQRVRPDVLLVNEIDFDSGETARLFQERYLAVSQGGQRGLAYPHVFTAPVNTGVPSGSDLNHNGRLGDPDDAFGFGRYPGQYGMAVYSVHLLDVPAVRTFQRLSWRDMPGHLMPDGQGGRPEWYSAEQAALLRLSSKSHWDVPVVIGATRVHLLGAHPTPAIFDGPEDRNGRRNHDEIRLLADYVAGGAAASYIVDDAGRRGGIDEAALFVVMGDMNSDPSRDAAPYGRRSMDQILGLERVQDPAPTSEGGLGGGQPGPPAFLERRTTEFGRIDYVLPSRGLSLVASSVFWPAQTDPLHGLVGEPEPASDHRLVFADVEVPQPVASAPPQEAFWNALRGLCGRAYEGRMLEGTAPGDAAMAGVRLVMHVRGCGEDVIRIPFHVGEDRSRTWVVSRTPTGLRLKHDHRHADGMPDPVTNYGGDTREPGSGQRQAFPADAETAAIVPAAATNVWTLELRPGERFVYALSRESRRFRAEFDLSREVPPPPAPWGEPGSGR